MVHARARVQTMERAHFGIVAPPRRPTSLHVRDARRGLDRLFAGSASRARLPLAARRKMDVRGHGQRYRRVESAPPRARDRPERAGVDAGQADCGDGGRNCADTRAPRARIANDGAVPPETVFGRAGPAAPATVAAKRLCSAGVASHAVLRDVSRAPRTPPHPRFDRRICSGT